MSERVVGPLDRRPPKHGIVWHGTFPMWQPTIDGRRILTCTLTRPLPLPAMMLSETGGLAHHGAVRVGTIEQIGFHAERDLALVTCIGIIDADRAPHDLTDKVWYLGPDLGPNKTIHAGGRIEMHGELIAVTLQLEPAWRGQHPVTVPFE